MNICWVFASKRVGGVYEETYDDLSKRGPDFCEKSMGVIRDTMWLKINCLTNHWQFQPSTGC